VFAFPNHVPSTEYTTGGLQVVETSWMINGNRSSISSLIAKALNTSVNKVSGKKNI
jgi:hypothetical protein